jgi:glycosyltransferase involved in cell wall biosynthesis
MKILVVSNFCPPATLGGYEISCLQVSEALAYRGHEVHLLTSQYKYTENSKQSSLVTDLQVYRKFWNCFGLNLGSYPAWKFHYQAFRQEHHNQTTFRHMCETLKPDLVYFWNTAHISASLYSLCDRLRIKFGAFIFDHSLAEDASTPWELICKYSKKSKLKQFIKLVMESLLQALRCCSSCEKPNFKFIHYPTNYLQEFYRLKDIEANQWIKINWGVDIEKFKPRTDIKPYLKLLYVGQISEHKGVHTAVEALGILKDKYHYADVTLTIVGRCFSSDYQNKLQHLINTYNLHTLIQFLGFVDRDELPEIYRNHSILIFPSEWEEPMGITILEAMASGLVVVSSGRGGSAELIENCRTGLTFEVSNAEDCAAKIAMLLDDRQLFKKLQSSAISMRESYLNFKDTVDQIENHLLSFLNDI